MLLSTNSCAEPIFEGIDVDYYLDSNRLLGRIVPFLKLHCSLNWGRCAGWTKLVAWSVEDFPRRRRFQPFGAPIWRLMMSSSFGHFHHCPNAAFANAPYVVPPTWNKSQYHSELEQVWKAAASQLSTAENIMVSGYPLPESDQFFRFLYALGTVGDLRLKRLWVFDPDTEVENRFKKLIGHAMLSRFKFHTDGFSDMFNYLTPIL